MVHSILDVIANNARNFPERLCIVDIKGEHTYAHIWEKAQSAAMNMKKLGVEKGQCVLVECTQTAEYLICDFACNLVGAYYVPIEHKASPLRVQAIIEETDAALLICEEDYDLKIRKASFDEVCAPCEAFDAWEFPKAEDTAEILYTTGTTGKSKGIEISHANNVAIAENIAFGTEMKEGNVELIPLPLSHSHGLRCAYANFFRIGTIIVTDGVTRVKEVYDMIKKYRITALDLSPTAASVLLKLTRGRLAEFNDQFDYIQIGTAALPEETKEALCRLFPDVRLYNFYGSTESGRSCALNFNSPDDRKYCIGYPTKNAKFMVTDDNRQAIESSAENTGLLACAGAMNMKGYWRQPELTREIMKDGYIFSNDEGYIDERGFVYVLGRKDDIINYKGIKIAPEEIEEVAATYRGIIDCACVPLKDKVAGQVPKLFLVVKKPESFDKAAFMRFMEENIDANKVPKVIEYIDEIPRASNGKIKRKMLTAREA